MFPNYLDGGKVLFYTQKDNFGAVDYNNEKNININYLAICKYANEQGHYLFFCDDKFKVVSDYFFDTIDECKVEAENEYLRRLKIYIKQSRLMILFWNVIGIK